MHASDDEVPKREQRSIQSIEIGFRLVSVLERAQTKLSLKLIAERAGMPASKAHLYMVSFTRIGLVVQDPGTLHYGLGPYAVQLGLAGLRQLDVLSVARAPLKELQETCGLSVHLSVWGNMGPTIVAKFDGDPDVPLVIRVGHVLPLLTSATGRVFMALLSDATLAPVLQSSGVPKNARAKIVANARAELGRTGITLSDSQVFDGFAALSAPIIDNSGTVAATITILGLRSRVDLDFSGPLASQLKATCTHVSKSMGFEPTVAASTSS